MENETVRFEHAISAKQFLALRESVGFQKLTAEQAEKALRGTALLITAVCGGENVGIVRVLTDGVTDAYLTDVIVRPDFQGKGLGRRLLERTISEMKQMPFMAGHLACTLYANPGKDTFYEKFGFRQLPDGGYGYGMILELRP